VKRGLPAVQIQRVPARQLGPSTRARTATERHPQGTASPTAALIQMIGVSRSKSLSRSEVKWRELQLFSTSAHYA
jgi:hypothetical protein